MIDLFKILKFAKRPMVRCDCINIMDYIYNIYANG